MWTAKEKLLAASEGEKPPPLRKSISLLESSWLFRGHTEPEQRRKSRKTQNIWDLAQIVVGVFSFSPKFQVLTAISHVEQQQQTLASSSATAVFKRSV